MGAAKIARDITDRKRTEEAMLRAEKLAATGFFQLAATIAHEINNPMQALTNVLALVSYKTSLDENTRQLLSLAEAELSRIAHITRQMLSLYRESATPLPMKVTELLEDTLQLFEMRMRANHIEVERRYECREQIHAHPAEMQQLFANLLSNAIEAVGERGRIYIHVSASREWRKPERRGVKILIADSGPGIAAELRSRLFDPFVTTKTEKGTGLGLWVVKGIVAKHGGSVRVRSSTTPGRTGTAIAVFLPADAVWQGVLPEAAVSTNIAA